MDGNARWAKKNKINKQQGYQEGLNKINQIVQLCLNQKIKYLTLYALSSENIKRPGINIIYNIILNNLDYFIDQISNNNQVKVNIFGERKNLSKKIIKVIDEIENITKNNNGLNLNIAFNYGSKNELLHCFNNLKKNKKFDSKYITEKDIKNNLYLSNIPDPDILIRTGGFQRLSNFLLFYLSYTELFFTKTLWPEITDREIISIFKNYSKIERKYGL